jgi:acylglycerol lipase
MIAMLAMSSTPRRQRFVRPWLRPAILTLALLGAGCAARLPSPAGTDQTLLTHPMADDAFTMPDGARLPVRVWLPPGGQAPQTVVLALHGFNDSRDAWALPGPVFAQNGIAVFAPDQRGFGDTAARATWPGVATLVSDADWMARTLRQRYPAARLFVMGESMGGAITMILAAQAAQPPVDGYVMLAPAVWGRAEQGVILSSTLWLANGVLPDYRITASVVPVQVTPSDNRDALVALVRNPLTIRSTQVAVLAGLVDLMDAAQAAAPHVHGPTLVAYGERDMLVPASAMGVAWSRLPAETRRAAYPNGYHLLMRDRDRQAVIGDVIAWIRSPAGLLPSGADVAAGAWTSMHHPGAGFAF